MANDIKRVEQHPSYSLLQVIMIIFTLTLLFVQPTNNLLILAHGYNYNYG